MRILKLLNKISLPIIFLILLLATKVIAEETPVDIWNIDKKEIEKISTENLTSTEEILENKNITETDIYKMQSQNQQDLIELDSVVKSQEVKIVGLYDPEDNGLDINMWINSDGVKLKNIFESIENMNLSKDANEILDIALLTNAYYPSKNITEDEFSKFKSNWLIKYSNLDLIEEYLIKNQIINESPDVARYLVDQYLSQSNVERSCEFFSKILVPINDDYLSKFNVYCLINNNQIDEAILIYDLKKELGFKDQYFEKKVNFLVGYTEEIDETISENSILDFHLAHRTNPKFSFEPKEDTSKLIWKYLSTSNLLFNVDEIEITDIDKIVIVEKAVHEKNYSENDLYELYKRFQFKIDQLLNATELYKSLPSIEAKALIYQRILLTSETSKKLELMKILKDIFIKENISLAFDEELKKFLKEMNPDTIPANFTTFYTASLNSEEKLDKKIKFNNKIIHQSKLISYFGGEYSKKDIENEVDELLKKIKKDKKYFVSKKDIIFLETLKSDGVEISKKYDDLYEIIQTEMPADIQNMIDNNEKALALLRITQVIGEDKIENMDDDTIYFLINTLNQLNVDSIRNKILLKVLPLKV